MPSRPRAPLAFIEPMAATSVAELPRGPEWSYEIKLDGYRVLAVKSGDDVRLLSRRNKDLTRDFPSVVAAVRGVRATTVTLDGEIVAVDDNGVPRFQALQHRSRTRPERIVYYAFDLLQLDGRDLTAKPLDERRQRLADVVHDSGVLLSQPLSGDVDDIIEAARRLKLEGLVAKRLDSRYEPGVRSMAWQKLRLNRSQEFVVGGYSPGNPFDALLVGYYNDAGALLFAARVRAGFTPASRRQVFRRLGPPIGDARSRICRWASTAGGMKASAPRT